MKPVEKLTVKIVVSGAVQGVGYRYFIARAASDLDIKGFVKNMWNGDVEIIAEGMKEFLEDLIKKAKKGPLHASVTGCKVEWLEFKNKYDNFEIF